ncbi:hypothetical protein FY557_00010 [Chryseobacterium sp. SN22]|uniref:hypothetical protein n=1 Tax=Chryseobacterium sp. SN22 TaxID=2606431 RepID=UPI0011EDC9C8|nr:hypothetical protein [Chryseobacterium sp. SN22]KAA0130625.1 hypothetical protein FY557_00010 [Chryseobacterium sp. SN22]
MTVLILVLLTAFIVYFIIKIISATIISIDGKGIQVRECIRYLWNDIQLEKITVKHLVSWESKHDYRPEMNYLYFFHKGEKIEINIDDFDMTDYQLSQVLKIFRSRYNHSGL